MTPTNITIPFKERMLRRITENIDVVRALIVEVNNMPPSDYKTALLASAEKDLKDNRELIKKYSNQ